MNLYIGSSSIGVFNLLKSSNNKILKIKGGTAKGLYTNENGKFIINTIKNILKKHKIKCILLHFGEVDINFSYYYKICNENKYINYKLFCDNIYNEYIKFIDKLILISNCKYLIIKGLYPNPVKDNLKINQLLNYCIINDTSCIENYDKLLTFNFQEKIRKYYNKKLNNYYEKHNKNKYNNTTYFYYDLDKYILKNNKLLNKFIDIDDLNIHLRWEPMVFYHINILNKYTNFSKINLINLKKEEDKYLKYKINELKQKGIYKTKTNKTKTNKTKTNKTKTKKTKTKKTKINKIRNIIYNNDKTNKIHIT